MDRRRSRTLRIAGPLLPLALVLAGFGCGAGEESSAPATGSAAPPGVQEEIGASAKAMFILEPSAAATARAVRQAIESEVAPRLAADPRVARLVVSLPFDEEAEDPAVPSLIEVYGDPEALRSLAKELEASPGDSTRLHAYLVNERLPRRHVQDWPDGTPTPGVRMIAPMVRNPDMSRAEFDAYWRDEHTPIALAHTVPVLNYSQNTVIERLTEDSEEIDGIVGEQFASPGYARERMWKHPIQFARGVYSGSRFIDFGKARSQLMIETVIESGQAAQ